MGKKLFLLNMLVLLLLFFANIGQGQQTGCKVLLPAISGSYSGGCKNGLAQGKGIAQGIDHYEGQFSEGVPQGRGTYTWADGSFYKGQWVNGFKEGMGKMVYPMPGGDSIVTGYWKEDNYFGDRYIPHYKITRSIGVVRSNIRKISDSGSDITLKILIGGRINSDIEEFSMVYDNGNEYKSGTAINIQNIFFPFDLKIKYRTWNQLHTSQSDVLFEFTIFDPGRWEVTITN
jgi:hypothetical protein